MTMATSFRPVSLPRISVGATSEIKVGAVTEAPVSYTHLDVYKRQGQNQKTPLERSVIAPHSREEYSLPGEACAREVSWRILDDFGACLLYTSRCV
ncbi:hypothetical protein AZ019_001541 [Klebsiella pneumoniae]|nr:hypothetical protein AZ019_001541 [Klebsiella pneumoniae]